MLNEDVLTIECDQKNIGFKLCIIVKCCWKIANKMDRTMYFFMIAKRFIYKKKINK